MNAAMLEMVAPPNVAARVSKTFDLMEIAEVEIKQAMRRYPRARKRVNAAFGALCPKTEVDLCKYSVMLYKAHCRELLSRAARGEDLRPGTDAELCIVLCEASLRAPLDQLHGAIYEQAFERCGFTLTGGSHYREPWQHAVAEEVHRLRQKLWNESRKRS